MTKDSGIGGFTYALEVRIMLFHAAAYTGTRGNRINRQSLRPSGGTVVVVSPEGIPVLEGSIATRFNIHMVWEPNLYILSHHWPPRGKPVLHHKSMHRIDSECDGASAPVKAPRPSAGVVFRCLTTANRSAVAMTACGMATLTGALNGIGLKHFFPAVVQDTVIVSPLSAAVSTLDLGDRPTEVALAGRQGIITGSPGRNYQPPVSSNCDRLESSD